MEDSTRDFFDSLISRTNIATTLEPFLKDCEEMGLHTRPSFTSIDTLDRIGLFLNTVTAPVLNISKTYCQNSMSTMTFGMLFEKVCEDHGHTLVDSKMIKYTCDYHAESLSRHLLLAMLYRIDRIADDDNIDTMFRAGIQGLFHDIGKTVARRMIQTHNVSGFAGHGEIGAYMLLQLWHSDLNDFFTKKQWLQLCRVVTVHMCGYHCEVCSHTEMTSFDRYKWALLRIETSAVKNDLLDMSYADTFGAIPIESKRRADFSKFYASRDFFQSEVIEKEFCQEEFLEISHRNSGLLVMLNGHSGSGKSHLTKKLRNALISSGYDEDRILVACRDDYMISMTCADNGIVVPDEIDGEFYTRIYALYKSDKSNSIKINDKIRSDVKNMLMLNGTVFIDSLMNTFKTNALIPRDAVKKARVINVMVSRGTEIDIETASRRTVGTDEELMEKQLSIIGEHTFFSPFSCGVHRGNYKHLSSLASLHRFSELDTCCPQLATVVHPVTWDLGHDELIRQMIIFSKMGRVTKSIDTTKLHINELVSYLMSSFGYTETCAWFKERCYIAGPLSHLKDTDFEQKAIKIVYMDHNPHWCDVWNIETRGVILYENGDDWHILSRRLDRGMEVVSGYHMKSDSDCATQDISSFKNLSKIDDGNIAIIKYMLSTTPKDTDTSAIAGVLTEKSDGSYNSVALFTGETANVIDSWITASSDPYSNAVRAVAQKMKLKFLPVFGTKGTLFAGESMWNYILTCYNTLKGVSYADISEIYARDGNLLATIPTIMPLILKDIDNFYEAQPEWKKMRNAWTLSFEVICAHRQAVDAVHTELAISYPHPAWRFLGMSFNYGESIGEYEAHFQIPMCEKYFDTPLYWFVHTPEQVSNMIEGISNMFRADEDGKPIMTKDMYFAQFPPVNIDKVSHEVIDAEGFVYYHNMGAPITHPSELDRAPFKYTKVKTTLYYQFHKPNAKKLKELTNLVGSVGIVFPIYGAIREFFDDIHTKLKGYATDVREELSKACDDPEHYMVTAIIGKAIKGYQNRSGLGGRGPIVFHQTTNIRPFLRKAFMKHVPLQSYIIATKDQFWDIDNLICGFTGYIKPWIDGYEDRIDVLVGDFDSHILSIFDWSNQVGTMPPAKPTHTAIADTEASASACASASAST